MANDDPSSGDNTTTGTGGGSGSAAGSQGASGTNAAAAHPSKAVQSHPAFVGFIFPAQLDENGNPKDTGSGEAHFLACVFPYEKTQASPATNVHEKVDKLLGQPLFSAFLYPNPLLNDPALSLDDALSGGGGGHAALGGVSGNVVLYTGEFRAFLPVDDKD